MHNRAGDEPGIPPHRDGGGAGVRGRADEGEGQPLEALHVFDDADGAALAFEDGSLLDVQLEVRLHGQADEIVFAGVGDQVHRLADRDAVAIRTLPCLLRRQVAPEHEAAHHVGREARPFLVGERDDAQRRARGHLRLVERLDRLQRAQHAEGAVEAATGGDGVYVRPGQDERAGLAAGPDTEEVPDAVDAHRQAKLAHARLNVVASALVHLAERKAADAAVSEGANARERVEVLLETGSVDRYRLRPWLASAGREARLAREQRAHGPRPHSVEDAVARGNHVAVRATFPIAAFDLALDGDQVVVVTA